jgi:hypothetical protein
MSDLFFAPFVTPSSVDVQRRIAHLLRENEVLRLECGTLHDTLLRLLRHMRFVEPRGQLPTWIDVSGARVRSRAFQIDVKHAQVVLSNEQGAIVSRAVNDNQWK